MTTLCSLPPTFLLPAWNRAQLAVLITNPMVKLPRRQFSQRRRCRADETAFASEEGGYSLNDARNEPRVVRTYRTRRQEGFETSNETSKEWLRGRRTLIRKVRIGDSTLRERETQEARLSEEYQRRQHTQALASKDRRSTHGITTTVRGARPIERRSATVIGSLGSHAIDAQTADPSATTSNKQIHKAMLEPEKTTSFISALPHNSRLADSRPMKKIAKDISQNKAQTSLVDELFPEQSANAKQRKNAQPKSRPAEIPEMPLPRIDDMEDEGVLTSRSSIPMRQVGSKSNHPLKTVPVILVLENALPGLVEADFRRIAPKGRHIEDWRAVFEPIAMVTDQIKGHNADCYGRYYLAFKHGSHAKLWRDRVLFLHKIVKRNAPTADNSAIVPDTGLMEDGEDVGEVLREYALFAQGLVPHMTLHLEPQLDPTLDKLRQELAARIEKTIESNRVGRSVILYIDGWNTATWSTVRRMISVDGGARNMAWGNQLDRSVIQYWDAESHWAHQQSHDKQTKFIPQRWLVTLENEAEARRFVRAWHMRPAPAWEKHGSPDFDEPWPLIKAELVL